MDSKLLTRLVNALMPMATGGGKPLCSGPLPVRACVFLTARARGAGGLQATGGVGFAVCPRGVGALGARVAVSTPETWQAQWGLRGVHTRMGRAQLYVGRLAAAATLEAASGPSGAGREHGCRVTYSKQAPLNCISEESDAAASCSRVACMCSPAHSHQQPFLALRNKACPQS